MSAKKGSGMGARVAATPPSDVAAGFAAATGGLLPEVEAAETEPPKLEVVAINIRLPKEMHRTLRRIAFDEETSINALLVSAADRMLADRK